MPIGNPQGYADNAMSRAQQFMGQQMPQSTTGQQPGMSSPRAPRRRQQPRQQRRPMGQGAQFNQQAQFSTPALQQSPMMPQQLQGILPNLSMPQAEQPMMGFPDGLGIDNMVEFSRTPAGQSILQMILQKLQGAA